MKHRAVPFFLIAALLVGAVMFVYRDVGGFEFTNFDDPDYIQNNPSVRGGLSVSGVRWAFTTFHAANWHPLTWVSHMADASLFGLNAGAHHLVSLGLHAASSLLLFHLLRALTGALWSSAAAAALFALHPVQAESVAWVAERKTVLAGLLGIITVRAYLWHVVRPRGVSLTIVALLFAFGLLAKPMLVILPLLLLLLDWWPLDRFGRGAPAPAAIRSLMVEKLPLLALALISGIVTIASQASVDAVAPLQIFSLSARLANALLSAVAYLGDLILPRALTVYYPHPAASLHGGMVGLAALALATLTFLAVRLRRSAPYAAVGWAWYLIALFPVIGVLQVGSQARADRYLYLPLIGIALAVAWGLADLVRRRPRTAAPIALSGVAACLLLATAAHRQAGYWADSRTLWEHALAVHPESQVALYQLSEAEKARGRYREQAALLRRLLTINPRHERAVNNLCIARYRLGEKPEALLPEYRALLVANPRNTKALQNLGFLLIAAGRADEAIAPLRLAVELDPAFCTAINNLGRAYLRSGDRLLAARFFARAAACDPQEPKYLGNLELARQPPPSKTGTDLFSE